MLNHSAMLLDTCLPTSLRSMKSTRETVAFSLPCTTSFLRISVRPNSVGYAGFGISEDTEAVRRLQHAAKERIRSAYAILRGSPFVMTRSCRGTDPHCT